MDFFIKHKITTLMLIILSIFIYINYLRPVSKNLNIDKKSIHYTNDIYMSEGRIYNNYLTEDEKTMYMTILNNVKKHNNKIIVDYDKHNCFSFNDCFSLALNAHAALISDHPELLSYSSFSIRQDDNKTTIRIQYAVPLNILSIVGAARTRRIIDDIKKTTKDYTDEEKIKYVYTWIGENNKYDHVFTYDSKNQSIYNVFMKHNAVCAGFAKASAVIFQNIGIEAYVVSGYSTGNHMWNIVKLNGKYYNYDSTIPTGRKKEDENFYLGLQSEYMQNYQLTYPNWYPKVEKTNMNISVDSEEK